MTDEELDEKLESLTDNDLQTMGEEELKELVDRVYGDDEDYDEEDEPVRQALQIEVNKGETKEGVVAGKALEPEVQAATTLVDVYNSDFCGELLDLNATVGELAKQTEQLKQGDLSRAEGMLSSQAHLLDQMFNRLLRIGMNNLSYNADVADKVIKLAMKSQSQCRTTWEAISKIQNPPVTNYANQMNVAQNQQINNGQEINNPPNELLEKTYGQQLDTRAQGEAVKADSTVEALEEIHRSKDD